MTRAVDFLIIGAGIVGLAIARELARRHPDQSILVLEKEGQPGLHSSGRNSGVLHSGIYYPPGSLKAQVCSQGALEMAAYHDAHGIPVNRLGKVLVATNEFDAPQLNVLAARAQAHGIAIEELDETALAKLEPEARSLGGRALLVPSTAVGNPGRVMEAMLAEIGHLGVELRCAAKITGVDLRASTALLGNGDKIVFSHAINAAGLHADRIAHLFGAGLNYTLLPFKGLYWRLDPAAGFNSPPSHLSCARSAGPFSGRPYDYRCGRHRLSRADRRAGIRPRKLSRAGRRHPARTWPNLRPIATSICGWAGWFSPPRNAGRTPLFQDMVCRSGEGSSTASAPRAPSSY